MSPSRRRREAILEAGVRAVLAFILVLCAPGATWARGPDAGPLPWRVGGRVGFTVDAAAFPDSAGAVLDVYVRIPPATLAQLARDSAGTAQLRLVTRLGGAYGGTREREQIQEFSIEPADSAAGFGKVVGLRYLVRPGRHRLAVRLEDLQSRKRGLVYLGRNVTEEQHVEGEILVPSPQKGVEVSSLEFVWKSGSGGAPTAFERGGRTVLPNPERLYGLFAPELRATFAVWAPSDSPWQWKARILGAGGQVIAERESSNTATRVLHGGTAFDLLTVPAGDYDLEVRVRQDGDPAPLVLRAAFSVAWQRDSWLRNPRDVQDEVHFLFGADEEEAFALLSPGGQERALEEFWRVRDPEPETGENEARMTFLSRVAYANEHYRQTSFDKGMFTDMGRVFIRYGQPSEIVNQIIPTGDETLDGMLDQITLNENRPIGGVDRPGPGSDQRPFELWIYEGDIGLPPDADPAAAGRRRRSRLVFLFVDPTGLGDYRLRYSTE